MRVTEVYFTSKYHKNDPLELAQVAIVYDTVFQIRNCALYYFPEEKSYHLRFPERVDKIGKHYNLLHPIDKNLYYDTLEAVVKEWKRWQADEVLRLRLA